MEMAQVRHAGRWRAAGAAVTFLLAAVAGVVGNQLTGHLTAALVAFVVLLVAGMTVTFLLERHRSERASGDDQGTGGASGPGRTCDMRDARGVQIGDGNRQTNYFAPEPDPDRRE
jgi:RIP homotypic interaction motif